MMKLLTILAPFLIGRFMPQPKDDGPGIVEKTLLTYRKVLGLTLIGIVGAVVTSAGLIIGGYGIALGYDASGGMQWNGLTIAGLCLLTLGITGFAVATMITKYWHPSDAPSNRMDSANNHRTHRSHGPSQSEKPVNLMDVVTLLILDIVESRKAERENRYERHNNNNNNEMNTSGTYARNPYRSTNQEEASMH